MEFTYNNVNDQFAGMFDMFHTYGEEVETRNGRALRIPEPVVTHILFPTERVLFHQGRDANPIFHLFESLWMLAGSKLVEPLSRFNSRIHQYSDDGEVFNGAYGYRMRNHFGGDQLLGVIDTLREDPNSRQAVIQLWDAEDLRKSTLDKCCNTQLVFEVRDGRLNMTTFNRSNDGWWGYAGANAVHFTVIMQFIAEALKLEVGRYTTVSTNLHLYIDLYDANNYLENPPSHDDFYFDYDQVEPYDLLQGVSYKVFLEDCQRLMHPVPKFDAIHSPFIRHTMYPMMEVAFARKRGSDGRTSARFIHAGDWREVTFKYIQNREAAKEAKSNEG